LYFIEVYIYGILRKLTKAGENLLIFIRGLNVTFFLLWLDGYISLYIEKLAKRKPPPPLRRGEGSYTMNAPTTSGSSEWAMLMLKQILRPLLIV
jgi:hypothetical protein